MHGSVLGFFAYGALQTREVQGRDVLEVGSLNVNGSVRPMVTHRQPRSYTGIDVVDGPGVDRVVDAVDLVEVFGPDSFDVVISTEMLEHAADWQAAVVNMVTVLRPGGVLVVTTRSPGFAYHHPPDRWRFTQSAFAEVLHRTLLDPIVVMDDPEHPGVFVKARKPDPWIPTGHAVLRALRRGVGGVTPMREPLTLLALPANPDGCGYYRFWQPWTQLQQHSGHRVLLPPPGQHRILPDEDDIARCDVVAMQRPNGRIPARVWRRWADRAKTSGTKLVYEIDDDVFAADPAGLPEWLAAEIQATVRDCLRLADLVTCSTEPLAEVLREHNPNVVVVGNHIHADLLTLQRPRRDRVTVGWAGGDTHLRDLRLIQDPLRDLLTAHPEVDMHWVGTDYGPLVDDLGRRWTAWQPNVWDYYRSVDFDLAVAPLADTVFNRSRSPVKALEMAALGIPVVASDTPAYREFVRDGETGLLVSDEDGWRSALRLLVNDPAAREELGGKAKAVAAQYTIQAGWHRWAEVYETLAGWPAAPAAAAVGAAAGGAS